MRSNGDTPFMRCRAMVPERNTTEDQAIAVIDNERRFGSFICLLVWQMRRQHHRKRKLMRVFREIMRGVGFDDPTSVMCGASKASRDQTRARLLRAIESSARELAAQSFVPAELRGDFTRFAEAVDGCLTRFHSDLTSDYLLEGLTGIMQEIRLREVK